MREPPDRRSDAQLSGPQAQRERTWTVKPLSFRLNGERFRPKVCMSTTAAGQSAGAGRPAPRSRGLLHSKLPTEPLTHLRDRVVYLGHAAGAHDERVLTALNGAELLIVASRFRPQRELHGLVGEQ